MHLRPVGDAETRGGAPVIAQLLALQVVRRALTPGTATAESGTWREVGTGLRQAHADMLRQQGVGLVVAAEGAVLMTRHERRLLRAAAAAQALDAALVDNLIFSLAPARRLRPVLAEAVHRLAAGLARHGHRLPLAHRAIPCNAPQEPRSC